MAMTTETAVRRDSSQQSPFSYMLQTVETSAARAQAILSIGNNRKEDENDQKNDDDSKDEEPDSTLPAVVSDSSPSPNRPRRSVIMTERRQSRYKKIIADEDIRQSHSDHGSGQDFASPEMLRASKSDAGAGSAEKKLDKYGFIINMDAQGNVVEDVASEDKIPTSAEAKATKQKERTWGSMVQSWESTRRRRKLLSKRLRKGIPDSLRGKVWVLLGSAGAKIERNPGRYEQYVKQSLHATSSTDQSNNNNNNNGNGNGNGNSNNKNNGRNSSKSNGGPPIPTIPRGKGAKHQPLSHSISFKATQETIERDIHRTYPRHAMFQEDESATDDEEDDMLVSLEDDQVTSIIAELEESSVAPIKKLAEASGGQAALRRVLRAYSVYDRDVGYCQGMNFIAGMFLTFMSEEQAFWMLVAVMNDPPCRMRGMFGEGMHETHEVLYIAEKLTVQFLPKLAKHLEKEHIHVTMYATQWLLTLYTSSFQFDLVTRVWDCFLAEGWKIVYRVMLALLQQSQAVLMTLSFEEILAYFRDLPEHVDGNKIADMSLRIQLRRKHINKYRKEWLAKQKE